MKYIHTHGKARHHNPNLSLSIQLETDSTGQHQQLPTQDEGCVADTAGEKAGHIHGVDQWD